MADFCRRVLGAGDAANLSAFLARRAETSLLLISNLARAGVVDRGQPHQATYMGEFEGDALVAVVAHCWNGNLIFQAPTQALQLARAAIAESGRPAAGLIGPWDQIAPVRVADDFANLPASLEAREILFALDLDKLIEPPGEIVCRRARMSDHAQITAWRVNYEQEALGAAPDAALHRSAGDDMARVIADGTGFVAETSGEIVAYSGFNATTPRTVQVGGVFTPPARRGRGHGRSVVAGQLSIVRDEGVARAILFTAETNIAAKRAYTAIGFSPIGAYGLILFRR